MVRSLLEKIIQIMNICDDNEIHTNGIQFMKKILANCPDLDSDS